METIFEGVLWRDVFKKEFPATDWKEVSRNDQRRGG